MSQPNSHTHCQVAQADTHGILAGLSLVPIVVILASLAFSGRAKKYLEEYNWHKANNEAEKKRNCKK